ncbi:MAG TPA: YccF domain-containing protein [Ruminococcus sp.]|nr:YccF domain-containing protein [Ruminococcus sp.]
MGCLGNILWFIFGGFIGGLIWLAYGVLWCLSIVGIPVGVQCFKLAGLAFFPFGKEVHYGGGPVSLLCNVIWLITSGVPIAVFYLVVGIILCATVVGIPFGAQMFKLAKLALMPFGSHVR